MLICPRCETTLSNFEVNQGYKDITDISVYVKFKIAGARDTYLLAWTTTPWTLPGNVALAVNGDVLYAQISIEGEVGEFILGKERLGAVLKDKKYKIIREFKGKELVGMSYEPVFSYYKNAELSNKENAWKVCGAEFVTTQDGSGIVHIAPAFGADDLALAQKENLPVIQHVGMDGLFKSEVSDFVGQFVKPKDDHQKTDIEIIKWLAQAGKLFGKEKIVHSYPHCWRCDTPLLNYATSAWFLKVTDLKDKMVKENKKVSWVPAHMGENRFGRWLEEARDWNVSRSRFWGAPMPIWRCVECKKHEVIGSIEELKQKIGARNTYTLVRHGEAESNALGLISGNNTPERHLTENGRAQVLKTAKKLKKQNIDMVFASPLTRTKETAEMIVEKLGLPKESIIFDERLKEVQTGEFEGKKPIEYHNFFTSLEEKFTKAPQGGESLNDLKKRLGDFLYEIDSKYEGKNILIVTHEYPVWMFTALSQGFDVRQSALLRGEEEDFINTGEMHSFNFVALPHNALYEADLHRPYIDDVSFQCECGSPMKRIPEVFDTWYDSGSMPFASEHYPFEHKKEFEKRGSALFPADFIAEGQDQTRGWFYTLLVLGVALFGKSPYKNVVVNGIVLAEDGQKMSKRLKNYPDLSIVLNKYGSDAMRFFLMSSPVVHAEDLAFSEKGVDEVMKKTIMRLKNVVSFYELYSSNLKANSQKLEATNVLDQWILARLNQLISEVTAGLDIYELDKASRPIADFVDDLSVWYVRRSRDRFKSDDTEDRDQALNTTRFVLKEFAKVSAPFMPFVAEEVFQKMKDDTDPESVHLTGWPESLKLTAYSLQLIGEMTEVRRIVSLGLEARAKVNIKVRQPLAKLECQISNIQLQKEMTDLIKDEVNVKEVVFMKDVEGVRLDTNITPELKEEGMVRELMRAIQDMRKKKNLEPKDLMTLLVKTGEKGKALIEKFKIELSRVTGLRDIQFGEVVGEALKIEEVDFSFDLK
jgi:isoleucyl-tRNA synthetase